ncbi:MAG TPA: endopeptidase La [Ktedonobacterales bacterium]
MAPGNEHRDIIQQSAEAQPTPLVLLKDAVIFPRMRMNINIGRERSLVAVKDAQAGSGQFIAGSQRQSSVENPGPEDAFPIATLVEIQSFEPRDENSTAIQIVIEGVKRVRLLDWVQQEPYPAVTWEALAEEEVPAAPGKALLRQAQSLFDRFATLSRRIGTEELESVREITDVSHLADAIASHVVTECEQQQEYLSMLNPLDRLEKLCVSLGNEIEILELENKIRQRVRQQVDKNQREYYLKEQLRAIQEELGSDQASEVRELREKMEQKNLPAEILARANKEIDRLERMPAHSAEVGVLRNYLDWILALPWQERTEDRLDMAHAQEVLDADHYGLEKVKERIVEFLAVRQLRIQQEQRRHQATAHVHGHGHGDGDEHAAKNGNHTNHKGPILCLIGPPGVGKTSLGRSVAQALGRKFVRISLGGVHDEAEIRGHRRTYVSALPGRIIQAMKTAGVRNPVFLLDEIDKLTSDYRGDPSAALLEVLDPEQNSTFTDHYMELPYDLSEVFFICTGNNRYQIPRALADRMDVVEIPGYTEEEKIEIARTHLLPKVLGEHGLGKSQVQIPVNVMRFIVNRYTREAGVRNLERQLATICRKAALRIVQKPNARIRLSERNVEQYLGVTRYSPDKALEYGQVGVATGLAWTSNGGALLPVEVVTMPGKGHLMVTGQLGDVMQESARAGLSYIRSRAPELNLPESFPDDLDIHIHLPEGAIPKDGPSAGITMALAIISALTRQPIRSDLAMTGEITLRGRVLAIGGLKEKTLAAHRVGIRHLIIPEDNVKDLAEIPTRIREEMKFTPVASMDQVLKLALMPHKQEDRKGPNTKVAQKSPPPPVLVPTEVAVEGEMPLPGGPEPASETPAM